MLPEGHRGAALRGALAGVPVGLWGLTFKANTDDLRDSPALAVAASLLDEGARLRAYDPVAG
ncbi:MAG: UDP binding domain-containing protein, partial [Candidatus Rokuibacteriota bacterium]